MWSILQRNQIHHRHPAVIAQDRVTTWGELITLAEKALQSLSHLGRRRVGLVCGSSAECFAALAGLDQLHANVFLLDAGKTKSEIDELSEQFKLHAIVRVESIGVWDVVEHSSLRNEAENESALVTILTSGTTGKPKAVRHTWQTLGRPVAALRIPPSEIDNAGSASDVSQQRWLLTYRPQLYAGLQVVLHAFASGGALVVPDETGDRNELVSLMQSAQVAYVSATPSFWRGILLNVSSRELSKLLIKQITLGGEMVDQGLLDALARTFDGVRITHIYATTELGKCFSVTDGRAGFPAAYLDTELDGGVLLRVDEGQLYVRSKNRMVEYDPLGDNLNLRDSPPDPDLDGWIRTGDLVEVANERVMFVGRDTDIINVGGYKVNPTKVEQVVRSIPAVLDVRVFGQSSSVTGQIVACDIVLADGSSSDSVLQAVREAALTKLDRFHQPRIVNVVEEIEVTAAGKVRRSS